MKTGKNLSLALGAAAAVVATTPALAVDNPFAMQKLDGGYPLAQADMKKADDKK